jgi:preprotein translocase subunit SecG
MQLFATFLHVFLSIGLILIILLQPGKDGPSALGGGGNQMYGPRGQSNLLSRATTVVAVLFMGTSITLAWFSSDRAGSGSEVEDELLRQQKALQAERAARGKIQVEMPVAEPGPTDLVPPSEGVIPVEGAPLVPSPGVVPPNAVPAGSEVPASNSAPQAPSGETSGVAVPTP